MTNTNTELTAEHYRGIAIQAAKERGGLYTHLPVGMGLSQLIKGIVDALGAEKAILVTTSSLVEYAQKRGFKGWVLSDFAFRGKADEMVNSGVDLVVVSNVTQAGEAFFEALSKVKAGGAKIVCLDVIGERAFRYWAWARENDPTVDLTTLDMGFKTETTSYPGDGESLDKALNQYILEKYRRFAAESGSRVRVSRGGRNLSHDCGPYPVERRND